MHCRSCGRTGLHEFIDLHHQPPSNSFLTKEQLDEPETYYPLKLYVCDSCWLVQLPESKKAEEIFTESYPYYSSQSPANVSHAKEYAEMMVNRFHPKKVMEIGSNDGYMLQWFAEQGMEVLGIDPSTGPALDAIQKKIPTIIDFFSKDMATHPAIEGEFDLICSINTIAHQPHINDFVKGMQIALAPNGIITAEFPHLMHLIDECQFDTIYHEHYSYFSFSTICSIFHKYGLEVFDVDELPEHGGSLRIYAQHELEPHPHDGKVAELLLREQVKGMFHVSYYQGFQYKVDQIKLDLMSLLIDLRAENNMVVGYGAAAKGNTLLNYCGIGQDLVEFVVDRSPHKQGKYLPGSHIPVYDVNELWQYQPDYVLVLPWNLRDEIMEQLKDVKQWYGKFIIPSPVLEVI